MQPGSTAASCGAVIGLIGLPRSGTTLIHRAMAAHSRVDGVIEPFQTGRARDYSTTDLAAFLSDFKIAPDRDRVLVVKETTTRPVNARYLFDLLASAQAAGIYTGLIIILRCPFEAYLSQIEAARDLWAEKKLVERSPATFKAFVDTARKGLQVIVTQARRQHFRIISYEQFCLAPATELARLMALIPCPMEDGQLTLAPKPDERRRGDPKTYEKGSRIEQTDRAAQVTELIQEMRGQPGSAFFGEVRCLIVEDACRLPDAVLLDRLTEIVLMRGG